MRYTLLTRLFLTGTAAEVTPVSCIEAFGRPCSGISLTSKIQAIYFDTVKGDNPDYDHWLSYVD